jgi:hypothetical protein
MWSEGCVNDLKKLQSEAEQFSLFIFSGEA